MDTRDLYIAKSFSPGVAEKHRRKGLEKGREFSPGFKVLQFGFKNGSSDFTPPVDISFNVSESGEIELKGTYSYTCKEKQRTGVLHSAEFAYDGVFLRLKFLWGEDTGRYGSATLELDVRTTAYNRLIWFRGEAKLEGEWETTDPFDPPAGNRMSLTLERLPSPPPK